MKLYVPQFWQWASYQMQLEMNFSWHWYLLPSIMSSDLQHIFQNPQSSLYPFLEEWNCNFNFHFEILTKCSFVDVCRRTSFTVCHQARLSPVVLVLWPFLLVTTFSVTFSSKKPLGYLRKPKLADFFNYLLLLVPWKFHLITNCLYMCLSIFI